ncbi:MAG: YCF48-related protein [Runella sp.]
MKKISTFCIFLVLLTAATQAQNITWRVTEEGILQKSSFNTTHWENVEVPTQRKLTAIAMANHHEGWAVGHDATLLQWDGERWSEVLIFQTEHLYDVCFFENEFWAVGERGLILHRTKDEWVVQPSSIEERLVCIEKSENGLLQIRTASGGVLIYENNRWQFTTKTSTLSAKLPE